jgi:hypothetical protein
MPKNIFIGIFGILVFIVVGAFFTNFNLAKNQEHCRIQAVTRDYQGPAPQPVCFATEAEALEGRAMVTSKDNLIGDFKRLFPDLPSLNIVNSEKPKCVAMIVSATQKTIKAQCFDTKIEREATVRAWQNP